MASTMVSTLRTVSTMSSPCHVQYCRISLISACSDHFLVGGQDPICSKYIYFPSWLLILPSIALVGTIKLKIVA